MDLIYSNKVMKGRDASQIKIPNAYYPTRLQINIKGGTRTRHNKCECGSESEKKELVKVATS